MDPSETHSFEDQWKKALNEASETPPPSIWEGIEAHLDREDDHKIIPLWWRSPKLWYAAASILALLLVGGGIWYNSRSGLMRDHGNVEMAVKNLSTNSTEKTNAKDEKTQQPATEEQTAVQNGVTEPLIAKNSDHVNSEEKALKNTGKGKASAEAGNNNSEKIAAVRSKSVDPKGNEIAINNSDKEKLLEQEKAKVKRNEPSDVSDIAVSKSILAERNTTAENGISEQKIASSGKQTNLKEEITSAESKTVEANLLASIPYSDLDVFMQKRYVFFKPAIQPEEKPAEPAKKSKEYYAGIGFMPASFNPDVQLKEAPTAFAGQFASRQKSLTGTNKAGASYAVQTQGGMRLSRHWSMEMGVNYLKGNARYEGGGYVVSSYNNTSSNVLQDALVGLAATNNAGLAGDNSGKGPTFASTSNIYIDVNKKASNDYQYLQLPLQAGFTLNPDKKLSYSVLGGMMANFFLSNELESASGETITTTANDDIYRSMNWAATTGLRFNYRMSSKWKASLTGSYQKSVTSGFKDNQSLEAHPYLYGVSWGVRYSF